MANQLYSDAVKRAVRQIKRPVPSLVMDIVQIAPTYLGVRVYQDNILEYNDGQREAIMMYLLQVRNTIRSFGIPCDIDGVGGAPPTRRK